MGTDNKRCIVCNSPIRKGLEGLFCGNVCHCKYFNIHYGTTYYEDQRKIYQAVNEKLDKKNESYNQALLESGKLYIDHPEEVAHVEVKDGVVELKDNCASNTDDLVLDDYAAREEAKELKKEQNEFCGLPQGVVCFGTLPVNKTGTIEVKYTGWIKPKMNTDFNKSGSKYLRNIVTTPEGKVDVYAVLIAFNVICPARQHAIKKLLCSGIRSKGSTLQDLQEARDAIDRAIQLLQSEDKKQ